MAVINTLREKMGKLVIGAIMFTLLAFILTDLISKSSWFGGGKQPDLAEIAGYDVSNEEFQNKIKELSFYFSLNTGRNPSQQEMKLVQDQAWNALIMDKVYQPQFKELGLVVPKAELEDMVYGKNISSQVRQYFTNPQTGEFDKERVVQYINLVKSDQATPQQRASWDSFLRSLKPARQVEKYNKLIASSDFANKYEAKNEYYGQGTSADISYVYVPFISVPDSSVVASDSDLKSYISSHENEFKREESRDLEYIIFDMNPSAADSAIVKKEVQGLYDEFSTASNDSTFASINSDDEFSFYTYNDSTMPSNLQMMEVGQVTQPEIVNGAYEMYKISRKSFPKPDSAEYKVAKIKKEFFTSDATINEVYRKADMFASSSSDIESFRNNAKEKGYNVLSQDGVGSNSERIGFLPEARSLVLWLFNDAEKGSVSGVKEVGNYYIVAAMKDIQEKGTAKLSQVKNQVERKVKNDKKAIAMIEKIKNLKTEDLNKIKSGYGQGAKEGSANINLNSSNVSGIGFAPKLVGIISSLNEEEVTKPFAVEDGVVVVRLDSKNVPQESTDLETYTNSVLSKRFSPPSVVADFPLSFFRLTLPRKVDDAVKEFAEIEDQRYKFF